jgi:prepilin-type N-terminal cleavage/methylation domain-containing protein
MKPMSPNRSYRCQSGFSLLEMAIVAVILSILSIQLIHSRAINEDYDRQRENRSLTLEAKTLLISFVQTNGYLPCPDSDNDGWENRTGNQCTATSGKLPHLMLGAPPDDAWNERLFYQVNTHANTTDIEDSNSAASYFSATAAPLFTLNTPPTGVIAGAGTLTVCSESETSQCNASTNSDDILEKGAIAVIVSFGKNSTQTWNLIDAASVNALSAVEKENADGDGYFWQSSINQADDALAWLTGYEMKYAILKSERGLN